MPVPSVDPSSVVQISLPWLFAIGGGLVSAVALLFRTLVGSQERRVSEMAEAHKSAAQIQQQAYDRLVEELQNLWGAVDRSNRVGVIRLCASVNIAPELKNDAAGILSEIDEQAKKRERR